MRLLTKAPTEWSTTQIQHIANVVYGSSLPAKVRIEEGGVPVYASGGIVGYHNQMLHAGPSIVIGRKGAVGTIYYVGSAFWAIDTAFYLDNISPDVDLEFLAHILRYMDLSRFSIVVGVPGINRRDIERQIIPLPPLSEQRHIVAILRKVDELRRLRREALRESEALLPALFDEMFGYSESNFRNWKTTTLEKVCTRITDGTHQTPPFFDEGIPFLFISNILNGFIDLNTEKYISSETFNNLMKRCPVEVDDILYSTVGSYGVAVIVKTNNPFSFQRHIAHIKPDHNQINANFLCSMLNSPYVRNQADRRARGVAQKTVNLNEISQFQIIVPPLETQISFTERITDIIEVQNAQSQHVKYTDELFFSLLTHAFSGELTSMWRERRREELALEAAGRDQRLRERGARLITPVDIPAITLRGPRDVFLDCLSEDQRRIWLAVQESEDTYITAGTISESYDLPAVRTRQTLDLLASVGLLVPVALWNSEISDFVEAYRLVRAERSEDQRDDDAYADDVAILAEAP